VRDDGFHLIDAEMVSLSLADHLDVQPASATSLDVVGVARGLSVAADSSNLIWRTLDALGVTAAVTVHKNIPAGGGLGGASTNAAAVLRAAGALEESAHQWLVQSQSLGADVAFCVRGGRARVTGIGEVLQPLDFVQRQFTLFTPTVGVSTPAVYRAWDEMGGPVGDNGNDLEPAACKVCPELLDARDYLGNATGQTPRLAGSGSTWFVEGSFNNVKEATVVSTVASSDVVLA
jgi:4-diphosphocytidyl-2-C-methyl-D-erythritol kinase